MANLRLWLGQFKLEYRPGKLATKIVVICAIVLCMATLLTLRFISEDLNAQTQELRSQAAELERENEELQEKIAALGSVESDERIAQEELGLAYPDTVIIQPEQ